MVGNLFLQNILRAYFPGYSSKHGLPLKHLKAADALMSCRTEEQGHSLYVCPEDNTPLQINHSCRHRSCPACAARKQAQWLNQQQQKLLPCGHSHMVFTLPTNINCFGNTILRGLARPYSGLVRRPCWNC